MTRSLIIAGGGIGGLAAALALRRAGVDATIYERAREFAEIGAGMSLWPNATRILKNWGILDQLLEAGEPVTHFDLLRPDGTQISTVPMGGFLTPALCLHRAVLHRVLREQLPPDRIEPDRRLVSFGQDGDGGVTAEFSGGATERADGLVGADGVNSAVRAQLHGASPPIYRGYRIWRGVAPRTGGTPAGHISETWGRGRRFGIMPMGGGRICWYATRSGPISTRDSGGEPKREILDLFKGWHHPVQALVDATDPADIIGTDARDRKALRRWGKGRVTLLGDAAHPITPNAGQGACLAIEDAACLAKAVRSSPDLQSAFRAYEASRRSRTAFIGWQARNIGAIGQIESRWMAAARDLVTRLVLKIPRNMQRFSVYAYEA